jgi:serine protease Do
MPGQRPDGRRGPRPGDEEQRQRGVGSGFILSSDGYVLTNAHVVEGSDEVFVTLTDKREFKARIVGADKRTDVAVVKIDTTGLPAVKIGDVNRLRVGEWVMAIGSPFGLDNTVTAGIVSAKGRDTGDFLPFIQTDVAINPGNSGGPLINMRGEVVGINSQIYSRSGGFMGISFAIPIDEATRVADQLRTSGRVIRGRIGVQIDQVTKEVAESIGLGKPAGALVRSVEPGGPAEKAGFEPGDIITRFDGKTIEKAGDLPRIVGGTKPGTKASAQVFRRGSSRELSVTVAEFEADKPRRVVERDPKAAPAIAGIFGLTVSDLTDAQKRDLKLKGGVRVDAAEGPAARAGVREGDVILAIDNTEVTSAKQFEGVAAKLDKARAVSVLVRRNEWVNYLVIRPGGR